MKELSLAILKKKMNRKNKFNINLKKLKPSLSKKLLQMI